MQPQLLLVEDDPNFGSVLKDYLELHDYRVTLCANGKLGWIAFQQAPFDACILDVMMPEKDGFTLARDIKKLREYTPLLFLTAKAQKQDILEGFKLGADDYITKPFDSEVLLCKIRAILKRRTDLGPALADTVTEYRIGGYQFNYKLRQLQFATDKPQKLSPKEAELLKMLCDRLNDVLPRDRTLQKLWGDDNYFTTRSMDVFIAKLRKLLRNDPTVEINNIHGNGFRLVVKEAN
jgi:DNA-binding response OmpR family regulator